MISLGMFQRMALPHCPHCLLQIAGARRLPYPPDAMRCPHCRLMIGAGRARSEATKDGDARSRGSAAGVLANAARRAAAPPRSHAEIAAGLRATAATLGCPVERLRMLDYQHAAERDPSLPDLSSVLATHATWKAARNAAAAAHTPSNTRAMLPAATVDASDAAINAA